MAAPLGLCAVRGRAAVPEARCEACPLCSSGVYPRMQGNGRALPLSFEILAFPPSLNICLSAGASPEAGSRSQPCAMCCCVLCLNPLASAGTSAALSFGDLNLQGDICMSRAQIITSLPDITCCLKAGPHRVRGTKGMELPDAPITSLNTVMRTNPSSE